MNARSKKSQELIQILSDFANTNGSMKEIINGITRDHRTLQQWIFHLFLYTFIEWAGLYKRDEYDIRNEVACRISYEICHQLGYLE